MNNKLDKKLLIISASLILSACAGQVPSDLGLLNGAELRPCPDKPNCVQTYDPADKSHFHLPLVAKDDEALSKKALTQALEKTGGQLISEKKLMPSGFYFHAEYESDWFRFVDDVEVVIKDGLIHLRSASRLGYSDLGVNAERFMAIKQAYNAE
jgi:uncharacterized protein (DUF1499 family)